VEIGTTEPDEAHCLVGDEPTGRGLLEGLLEQLDAATGLAREGVAAPSGPVMKGTSKAIPSSRAITSPSSTSIAGSAAERRTTPSRNGLDAAGAVGALAMRNASSAAVSASANSPRSARVHASHERPHTDGSAAMPNRCVTRSPWSDAIVCRSTSADRA
jgi:hypothetical protein